MCEPKSELLSLKYAYQLIQIQLHNSIYVLVFLADVDAKRWE